MDKLVSVLQPLVLKVRTDVSAKKLNGKMHWTKEALTKELLQIHVSGGASRGVCPIKAGESTTMVGLLDLDSHQGQTSWSEMVNVAKEIIGALSAKDMQPVTFRSSGGKGIHIYLLWDQPQDAYSVRVFFSEILTSLGYKNGTSGVANKEIEVFPKQSSVPLGGYGNQFILPFAGLSAFLEPLDNFNPVSNDSLNDMLWYVSPDVPEIQKSELVKSRPRSEFFNADLMVIKEMLKHIDPTDYDVWIKVGMAINYETNASYDGLLLWDEWSIEAPNYLSFEDLEYKWDSFKGNNPRLVTINTIRKLAEKGGWKEDVFPENPSIAQEKARPLDPNNHSDVARKVLANRFSSEEGSSLIRNQGYWYQHNGSAYDERSEEGIRSDVRSYLDNSYKLNSKGDISPFNPSMAHMNGVTDALKAATMIENINPPSWLDEHTNKDPRDFICMQNGILYVPSRELYPHSVKFFNLNSLPYDWEETGEPVEWLKFLNSVWPNDQESIETLQEIIGYLLTPDTRQQKMFLIKGPIRSGKGTILHVIKGLLGAANTCGPTLTSLSGSFGLQPLIGKLAAIIPDARIGGGMPKQTIVERLLMVSGEDSVTVEVKHKPSWNGVLSVRILILTNEVPQLGDAAGALASRFITLQMTKSFYGQEDLDLKNRVLSELPQIFNWALAGKERLDARGYFVQPEFGLPVLNDLEILNSPIKAFVKDSCELGFMFENSKNRLYKGWIDWCYDNGRAPGTKDQFCANLVNAFPKIRSSRRRFHKGSRDHFFLGIKLVI